MRSSAQLAALPDAAPARVGAFEIGPRIAAGGFGTVYFARRAGVHRLLAIKLAHAHLCDSPDVALMLEDEGRIASLVSHPNVARTFEAGVAEGRPYLVMELLDGEPISRVMRALSARADLEARERWGLVARTLSDAARGLHASHIATTP